MSGKQEAEAMVREIRRRTRRMYSTEEKIRIVLEGLRREESIAKLCRRKGIKPNLYNSWNPGTASPPGCSRPWPSCGGWTFPPPGSSRPGWSWTNPLNVVECS